MPAHAGYRPDLSRGTETARLPARFSDGSGYESAPQAFQLMTDVLLFTWMGAVMHQPGRLVEETIQAAVEFHPSLLTIPGIAEAEGTLRFSPATVGPVITVPKPCLHAYHGAALAYGHWWFDVVPSIWLWREQIARGDLLLLLPRDSQPWLRAILELLDIPESSCIETGEDVLFLPECVVATACSISNLRQPPPIIAEIGRALVQKVCGNGARTRRRRLYLTRSAATSHWSRQLENEGELIALLQARGFEVIDPGKMSIPQQIEMFSEAAMIVAPHGSALANIMFAPPGCAVIDLMPDIWIKERNVGWIYDSTNILRQSYVCLLGPVTWQSTASSEYRSVPLPDRSLRYRIEPPALAAAVEELARTLPVEA
jgi:capsular polysaccharide biosynthesis protein